MSPTLPTRKTTLNYTLPTAERPRSYTFEPPAGTPRRSGRSDPHTVEVADARQLAEPARLDVHGFELVPHATSVGDFLSESEVRGTYYEEVDALLRRVTGAEEVVVFDHTIRSSCQDQRAEHTLREPVLYVHNDYTT